MVAQLLHQEVGIGDDIARQLDGVVPLKLPEGIDSGESAEFGCIVDERLEADVLCFDCPRPWL